MTTATATATKTITTLRTGLVKLLVLMREIKKREADGK